MACSAPRRRSLPAGLRRVVRAPHRALRQPPAGDLRRARDARPSLLPPEAARVRHAHQQAPCARLMIGFGVGLAAACAVRLRAMALRLETDRGDDFGEVIGSRQRLPITRASRFEQATRRSGVAVDIDGREIAEPQIRRKRAIDRLQPLDKCRAFRFRRARAFRAPIRAIWRARRAPPDARRAPDASPRARRAADRAPRATGARQRSFCATPSRAAATSFANTSSRGEADTIDAGGANSGERNFLRNRRRARRIFGLGARARRLRFRCATRCVLVTRLRLRRARAQRDSLLVQAAERSPRLRRAARAALRSMRSLRHAFRRKDVRARRKPGMAHRRSAPRAIAAHGDQPRRRPSSPRRSASALCATCLRAARAQFFELLSKRGFVLPDARDILMRRRHRDVGLVIGARPSAQAIDKLDRAREHIVTRVRKPAHRAREARDRSRRSASSVSRSPLDPCASRD